MDVSVEGNILVQVHQPHVISSVEAGINTLWHRKLISQASQELCAVALSVRWVFFNDPNTESISWLYSFRETVSNAGTDHASAHNEEVVLGAELLDPRIVVGTRFG